MPKQTKQPMQPKRPPRQPTKQVGRPWPDYVAAAWGFAEATLFFIVPDVFISYRAIRGWKPALRASLLALAGAAVGGSFMYLLAGNGTGVYELVRHIPGISAATIASTDTQYALHGVVAAGLAPLHMTPFKVYAVLAPQHLIAFVPFIILSLLARIARFLLVAGATYGISKALGKHVSYRKKCFIHGAFWVMFYIYYFGIRG